VSPAVIGQRAQIAIDPATSRPLVFDGSTVRRIAANGAVNAEPDAAASFSHPVRCPSVDAAGRIWAVRNGDVWRHASSAWQVHKPFHSYFGAEMDLRPACLAVDRARNRVYLSGGSMIRHMPIDADGPVVRIAGTGYRGHPAASTDGTGEGATFNETAALTLDAAGNLYVADHDGSRVHIRRMTPDGVVTTRATLNLVTDERMAWFNTPSTLFVPAGIGLTADAAGNLFVANMAHHMIERIDTAGRVSVVAGHPGRMGTRLGPLPGSLSLPDSVAVSPDGRQLYLIQDAALLKVQLP